MTVRGVTVEFRFLRGNSSVGRARPCQGRGREFESRFPLHIQRNPGNAGVSSFRVEARGAIRPRSGYRHRVERVTGLVAEWSCSGLQSRVRRFNSDPGLQFQRVDPPRARAAAADRAAAPVRIARDAAGDRRFPRCDGLRLTMMRPGVPSHAARMAKLVYAGDLKSVLSSPFCLNYRARRSIVTTVCEHPRCSFIAWLGDQEPTRRQ